MNDTTRAGWCKPQRKRALRIAFVAVAACASMASVHAQSASAAGLPVTGKTCHFQCADGTQTCTGDLVSVCDEVPLFSDKDMADFIRSLDLLGRPFGEVPTRLATMHFACSREYHRTGFDMGCTRTVSMPHCMVQIQSVWFNLRELDHDEPRPVADDVAIDLSKATPFSAMHVSRVKSQIGGTGDDDCRGGK